jgi:threonine dehydratase
MTVDVQQLASHAPRPSAVPIGIEDLERARALLEGAAEFLPGRRERVAYRTPLVFSDPLSKQLGCRVWLKLENLQKTGSYKVRGAFNNIASLDPAQRERGVVTASAGNHAQGVAYAASTFGIADRTTIFVPIGTPRVKQDNTRAFGVAVHETCENFDLAREAAYAEAERSGRPFIEPFDDWATIAGQGTIGLEIIDELPNVAGIVAPVGGGGMIAGVAIAAAHLAPSARVIGVEAAGAPSMIWALDRGRPAPLPNPPLTMIADGIKVRQVGDRPYVACRDLIGRERFMTVPDTEIVGAVADLMVYAKIIAEGAGAIALAAARDFQTKPDIGIEPFAVDQDLVVIVSGGNIDPSFSWRILYEQTIPNLLAIRLAMPDRPGELLRMLVPIAQANVNIIDVDVNRLDARPRMGERIVEVCVAITGQKQADQLLAVLKEKGYRVLVSRWQDPTVDRAGNVSRSAIIPDRLARPAQEAHPDE